MVVILRHATTGNIFIDLLAYYSNIGGTLWHLQSAYNVS
jgi:hypothetical protein